MKKLIPVGFIPLILILLLGSCSRPPASEFYEADGIISIDAKSADQNYNWLADSSGVTHSLVSKQLEERRAGEVSFTFYVSSPGNYAFWLLGNTVADDSQPLQIRFLNEQDELISIHRLELHSAEVPRWQHIDQITEQPIVLNVESEGFYKVQMESGGLGGLQVSRLHLSKDGDVISTGAGYPQTVDWRMEPVIDKRLQQARIPPAWIFGVIVNQNRFMPDGLLLDAYYGGGNLMLPDTKIGRYGTDQSKRQDFSFYERLDGMDQSDSVTSNIRPFDLYPIHNLLGLNHKRYPAPWYSSPRNSGFNTLEKAIEILSDPDLVTYESPWLLTLPDWYDPENRNEEELSEELMVRTMQLSSFQNIMFLPFQSIDQVISHEEYIRELIEFRRELFPYIYSYTNRARTTGTKLITGDRNHPDQFLFGDYFLVAPVFEESADIRELYLPEGSWYHYETEKFFEGDQQIEINAPLFSIPFFVKAGAIIPKRADGRLPIVTGDNQKLILDVYGGDSGTFRLYEDDGETLGYMSGEFSTIAYRYFEGDGYSTFNIGAQVNGFPERRNQTEYTIRFKFVDEPVQISANGDLIPSNEIWSYDTNQRELVLNWTQKDRERTEFRIEF